MNKISDEDYEILINIYDKLDLIDTELFYLNDRTNIPNDARDFIICAMEKNKKYNIFKSNWIIKIINIFIIFIIFIYYLPLLIIIYSN